jgi:hypothetical protein
VEKFKSVFSSRTIITNLVTFLASIAAIWGLDLSHETQAIVVSMIVGVGTLLSSMFRKQADAKLVSTPTKAEEANLRADAAMQVAQSIGKPKPPLSDPPLVIAILALLLVGCQTTSPSVPVTPVVTPPVNVVDATIARADISKYCGAINIGLGFLETGIRFLKPEQLKIVQQASAGMEAYCENPPTDLATALEFLAETYRRVMALQRTQTARRAMARARTI